MSEHKTLSVFKSFFTVAGVPGLLFLSEQIISFLTSRRRDLQDYSTIDLSASIQIAYITICFVISLYLLLFSKRNQTNLLFRSPQIYLLIFIFICFISMLWSPSIMITGYRAFEALLTFSVLSLSNKIFFGIAFGLLGFYYGNIKNKGWLLTLGLITAISFFIWGDVILENTLFYGREGIGMEYTSGRDKIWEVSWEAITQKPFIGYGYVAGETHIIYNSFTGAISTHNFILSGLIGTGIIGVIPLILYFINAFRNATSKVFEKSKWKAAFASTIIMATIVSLTSPGIGFRVYGSWIPVVLVITLISGIKFKAVQELNL